METWPAEHLEKVPCCPVCGGSKRELMHSDLIDNVFHVAPGKWQLWRCLNCKSAFLDPRPTAQSIGLAYVDYYTHGELSNGKNDYETLDIRRHPGNGLRVHASRRNGLGIGVEAPC